MQATHNMATNEIREKMHQMKIELGLVFKHVSGGEEKVNVVNYLPKPPLPADEYYYEEDTYVLNDQTGGFRPNVQCSNQENWCHDKGNQGRYYGN